MVLRLRLLPLFLLALSWTTTIYGQYASTYPAPMPLFHKSPYFSAWMDASNNLSTFPMMRRPRPAKYIANKALGWYIGIRVDDTSYRIQGLYAGGFNGTTSTVGAYITPTRTIFTIEAGPVRLNLTYLTPIELQDWTLHSLPFAYAFIDIWATDSDLHTIQLYTDVAGQFISSDESNVIIWNTTITTKSIYHLATRSIPQPLTENRDMSEDGAQIFAYATTPSVSMTWQIANYGPTRDNFSEFGKLDNTSDTNYRAINNGSPAFAFALDLGAVNQTTNSLVFGIGLVRDPVLKYRTGTTNQSMRHLWWTRWSDVGSAVDDFLAGSASALSRAIELDNRIVSNATTGASQFGIASTAANLTDLYILSLRQTVGSLEFTTSRSTVRGMDDMKVFMKDVGYSRRTNPVEVLYASFPTFLFLNTSLAGALLEPLFEFQSSALHKNNYAAPDLGNSWPIVEGNTTDNSSLGIDSCGAMLIMVLAHAQKSGDGRLLFTYYNLLRKWADFLVNSIPKADKYMSSDGLYSSQANLALKGIMGLYAMGKINKVLESRGADGSVDYLNKAKTYIQQWQNQALSSDHVMATYGSNATWAMLYNLYAPRLIAADIIPEDIYEKQASWYANQSETALVFGLPYDSSMPLAVKAHWTLLSAGSIFNSTSGGRDALINQVHTRSFWQSGSDGNPAGYPPRDGGSSSVAGAASPAMGAVYSFLALTLPDLPITLPSGNLRLEPHSSPTSTRLPSILGAIFGTLGGLILLVSGLFFLRRQHGRQSPVDIDNSPPGFPTVPGRPNIPSFLREKLSVSRPIEAIPGETVQGSGVAESSRELGNSARESELRRDVRIYDERLPDEPPPKYARQQ